VTLSTSASRHGVWCRSATLCRLIARPRLIALALVPVMFVASALAQQDYSPLSRALTVERLPGQPVYYVVGQPGIPGKDNEGHTSNAGFVVTSQGVVVFDALGSPNLGWDLLQQIRKISDQPIRYIVVSHYHADHIYGLQVFKDHSPGAVIVAQERAGEYRENEQTAMREPIRGSTNVGKRCFPGSIAIHASSRPISLFDNASYSTSAGSASC
jgi:glyoxylase-like metal-dependent hydrolase (beta-lactamase superfamily II)